MKGEFDTMKALILGMVGALILVILSLIVGQFVYDSYEFEATVIKIEYEGGGGIFGSTNKIVRLDDGSVLRFDVKLPKELKEGHTYILEYRNPYFLGSESLVIIEKIK